jgi:tetratricopeptide (TPR) repeat protein
MNDLTNSITLDPKNEEAYFYRGLLYDLKDDYEKAISDYSEAIRLDPDYSQGQAYYKRGLAYKALGKNAESQADFDKAKHLGYKVQ